MRPEAAACLRKNRKYRARPGFPPVFPRDCQTQTLEGMSAPAPESIETDTPTGRAMWQMICVLAELEWSLIAERTEVGVAAARARGVRFGRKPKLTRPQIARARKHIPQGERAKHVPASFHVGRTTLYRALAALP
jgi:DNA invertase Pin-like site-specific DNA recombinase